MSADNRTPHTDALATLGMIHTQQEHRDAIHLGVEPVTTRERLLAGQHVAWDDKSKRTVRKVLRGDKDALGIVDPFLEHSVMPGDNFWLIVYPRQITSLRHVWEHPNFTDSQETEHTNRAKEPKNLKDIKNMSPEELSLWVSIGSPVAVAYQNIDDYAKSLSDDYSDPDDSVSTEELIETALYNLGQRGWDKNYISKGGLLEGVDTAPEFWDNLSVLINKPIEQSDRSNFFSCSC